jgi:GntR family transcriptional regulator
VLSSTGRGLKHVQVREYVRSLVAGGAPGSAAPSERELVHRFGVARMTVRQAMDALVVEGVLERIPGRGTFVARPRRTPTEVLGLGEELARGGLPSLAQSLLNRVEQAGPGVARALGVAEGEPVVHWRRLRESGGTPVCLEDSYLPERLVGRDGERPSLLDELPESLYDWLAERGLRPGWVEDAWNVDLVAGAEAVLLGLTDGGPVMRRQRRALAGDRVVEVSRAVIRADRFTLRLQLGSC